MKPVELIGHVDEQHQLHVELPANIPPGRVKITLEAVEEGIDEWRALINHAWSADWNDPREDIYTLEDGEPEHGPR